MTTAKKELGQYWLNDEASLNAIVEIAEISKEDVVLEIGPGEGSLTKHLVEAAEEVIAVEFDQEIVGRIESAENLKIEVGDIRHYDLTKLPKNYKVVANLPYYLTSFVLQLLTSSENPPSSITVLIQKEVAERIAAKPGNLSILALSLQIYGEAQLGRVVEAALFEPSPKVDSQIIHLKAHSTSPIDVPNKSLMRLIKVGFSSKRKTLINNISAGLGIEKPKIEEMLNEIDIRTDVRAQAVSLNQWQMLHHKLETYL